MLSIMLCGGTGISTDRGLRELFLARTSRASPSRETGQE
jgi:hypothetical protein